MVAVALVVAVFVIRRAEPDKRPWHTTDVWYHESEARLLGSTGKPQLVEFFHPD